MASLAPAWSTVICASESDKLEATSELKILLALHLNKQLIGPSILMNECQLEGSCTLLWSRENNFVAVAQVSDVFLGHILFPVQSVHASVKTKPMN